AKDVIGFSTVYQFLDDVGLSKVPIFFTSEIDDEQSDFQIHWMKVDTKIKKLLEMDVLIGFTIQENRFKALEKIMYIEGPFFGCPFK
ncbi:hypothetical protein HHI36_009648, partial [Cryptolaemus montrouzieri]